MKFVIQQKSDGAKKESWRWLLVADSGRSIAASSREFPDKRSCLGEVKAVQSGSARTPIVESAVSGKAPAAKPANASPARL